MPPEGNGARPSIFELVRRGLRGPDHVAAPTLPIGEALHPVCLLAVAVLVVNDWVLKPRMSGASGGALGSALGGALTGKLSDLAGLACAPVLLTAALGLAMYAAMRLGRRLGIARLARIAPHLTRRRLRLAVAATGAVFVAVKLWPAAAHAVAGALSLIRPAHIVVDPTDLLCLPALAIAYAIGRDELRRIQVRE